MAPGVRSGAKFTITGPDGTVAVFNDTADANNVGTTDKEVTGLDSPDVRATVEDLVEADGAVHGPGYFGARPLTFRGTIYNHASIVARNTKEQKLLRAVRATRKRFPNDASGGFATLTWDPAHPGVSTTMKIETLRLTPDAPPRITGGWNKEFHIALTASDPLIYGPTVETATLLRQGSALTAAGASYDRSYDVNYEWGEVRDQETLTNDGDYAAPCVIRLYGPGSNPGVRNATTGEEIDLRATLATTSDYIRLDTRTGQTTLHHTTTNVAGTPFDSAVVVPRTRWFGIQPGANTIEMVYYSSSAGAKIEVDWRDTWL